MAGAGPSLFLLYPAQQKKILKRLYATGLGFVTL